MAATEFQPGQRIEDDVIGERLEGGVMAELFLARDRVLNRKVILKVLSSPFCEREECKNQFLREAGIQANLDSPHGVQVFRSFVHQDRPCLVLQHVQGTDLEKIIKRAKSFREKNREKTGKRKRVADLLEDPMEASLEDRNAFRRR